MNAGRIRAWRLAIAASGLTGVVLAARQYDVWWTAFSQLSSLAVFATYLVLAFREPPSPWLRGALASQMALVSLAFLAMQQGNLWDPYSVFEHVLTPALVVADYLFVGHNQAQVRWWHPPTWLVPPSAYLAWYVVDDLRVYGALDPGRTAPFLTHVALLALLALGVGLLLYDVGRRSSQWASTAGRRSVAPPELQT